MGVIFFPVFERLSFYVPFFRLARFLVFRSVDFPSRAGLPFFWVPLVAYRLVRCLSHVLATFAGSVLARIDFGVLR